MKTQLPKALFHRNTGNLPPFKTLFSTLLLALTFGWVSAQYSGGAGTVEDPFQISSLSDLVSLSATSADHTKHFIQTEDIDASSTTSMNGGQGFIPISVFSGSYNGSGHIINGLYINRPGAAFCALFSVLPGSATISNLGLTNVNITGNIKSGALVGVIQQSGVMVSNCFATGVVIGGNSTGGLVGEMLTGKLLNCFARVNVTGGNYTGGLTGDTQGGVSVTNCYSTGTVTASSNPKDPLFTNGGTGINLFFDTQTSGYATSGKGTAKTTAEMKTQSTFTNATWDFDNIWYIDVNDNDGYPSLRAFLIPPVPTLLTESIAGLVNSRVQIPVSIKHFTNFQTLQGSIDFNGTGLGQIDSIVPTSALTSIDGIMGSTANLGNGTLSYSYESATAPFSFANGTQLFTIYGRLQDASTNTCGTPTVGFTPHQWGKLEAGNPVNTTPTIAFGEICANTGAGNISITEIINCPGATGYSVLFDYIGNFEPSDNFVLTVDNNVVGNVSPGFYEFSVEGSLAVGNHSINISRGSVSADSAYSVSNFAAVSFTINGTDETSGSDVLVCPGADANVSLTSANRVDWEFRNFETEGSSKTFTLSNITDGGKLHVYTYNNEGCKSADVTGFVAIVGLDKTPPTLTLSKTADTLNFTQGSTSGTYDISSLLTYSDNCEMAATPIVVINLSNGNEEYAPNAITILPGENNLEVVAFDKAGAKTTVSFVVYGALLPEYTLSFDDGISTNGVDENEVIVFNLNLNSTATLNTFKTISGKINLGGFAKEVLSVKPVDVVTEFAYTFENGILSYTITDITLAGNKTAFNFAIKPNMAAGAADEVYTPTHTDAAWTTEYNREAVLTNNFEANTLIGVPVISGSFIDRKGDAIADEATVSCTGCINTTAISNVAIVNFSNNSYSFRALKNTVISIGVADNSGRMVSAATAINNVVNSRKHVLGEINLDQFNRFAADVDNTNDINTLDILQQRQNINGELALFLNSYGNRAFYNFLTNTGLGVGIVSNYNVGELDHIFSYTALEIGKVENNNLRKSTNDSKITLRLPQTVTRENARIKVPVLANTYNNIAGYQFTIDWNAQELALVSLINGKHNVLYNNNEANTGVLTLNYLSEKGNNENLNKDDTLFMLEFDVLPVISNGGNRECRIAISAKKTAALATNNKADIIELAPTSAVVAVMGPNSLNDLGNGYGIGNAVPNPFTNQTTIAFSLPNDQEVTFTVFNNLGQFISQTLNYKAGLNSWILPNQSEMSPGVYFINLSGENLNSVLKVVKL